MDVTAFLDGLTTIQRRLVELQHLLSDGPTQLISALDLIKAYAARHLAVGPEEAESECEVLSVKVEPKALYPPDSLGAVYRELLDLGQPWKCRYPIFDLRGQFGDHHDDDPSGPEYLDVRPTPLARVVSPFGRPSLLPMALINGYQEPGGAGVPPHNLHDLWIAYEQVRQNPSVSLDDLMEVLVGPDPASGGIVWGYRAIHDLYEKGEGELTFRSVIDTEIQGPRTRVAVLSLPPGVLIRDALSQIREAFSDGRIPVYNIQDLSTPERVRIVIDASRRVDPETLKRLLYEETPLERTEKFALSLSTPDGSGRTFSLIECLKLAVNHCGPAWHREGGEPAEKIPPLDVLLSHGGYESPLSDFIDPRRSRVLDET